MFATTEFVVRPNPPDAYAIRSRLAHSMAASEGGTGPLMRADCDPRLKWAGIF